MSNATWRFYVGAVARTHVLFRVAHESKEYHEQLKRSSAGDLGEYHTYEELKQFITDTTAKYSFTQAVSLGTYLFLRSRVTLASGKSVQGRDIWAIRITNNASMLP